jgi:DNA-binding PadR family transcriptional regulator
MSVRHSILALLAQHPRHGYDLRAAFEALVGGELNWDVKPAQIYTTLGRLEENGLVRQEGVSQSGGPEKRIYSLTPAGQLELDAWFESGVEDAPQRDEFFVKLMLSLTTKGLDAQRVIQTQRLKLFQDLHDITARRNQADPKRDLTQIFLFEKTIMHLEANLRWLEMIEARLDDMKRQPPPAPEIRPRGRPKKTTGNDVRKNKNGNVLKKE